MMRPERTLFFDVDTQRDFMIRGGALYVEDAERIIPNLAALTELSRRRDIKIIGTVDRHYPTDRELQRNGGPYPDHCINGSPGQRKISETTPRNALMLENRTMSEYELAQALKHPGEVYIEKQHVDFYLGNRNAAAFIEALVPGYDDVVVYGVCTEICVDYTVKHLLPFGKRIHTITDAIGELEAGQGRAVRQAWRDAGVELIDFAALCERLDY